MDFKQKDENILERLSDAIKAERLIAPGEKVLVAFSGGADSVALLLMLHSLSKKLNTEVFAAHLNHGIRGEEADRDERFCAELCGKMGIPIEIGRVCVPTEAKATGEGLEECARRLRYDFLGRSAEKFGCAKIATAHHADDNIETVLLHLIRGSGLSGLVGISAKRGNLIRPLLAFRKRELIAYLDKNGQNYVTDSTNSDTAMTRNKIRHELLDTVYEINPRADVAFSNMSRLVRSDNEYLLSLARGVDKNASLAALKELTVPVLSRFLQLRYAEYTKGREEKESRAKKVPQISFVHITPIIEFIKSGSGNADFPLPGNAVAHASARGVVFTEKKGETEDYEIPLYCGENDFSQLGYKILITNDKKVADGWQNIYKPSIRGTVKSDTILFDGEKTPLCVRSRKSGDAYVYAGHTRDVRRRLIDLKIPAYERNALPCICDGEGIIWVPNLRVADRAVPKCGENALYIVYAETDCKQHKP